MTELSERQKSLLTLMEQLIKECNDQRLGELINRLTDRDESLVPRALALRIALQSSMNLWAVWRLVSDETAQYVDKDGYTALHVACFHGNIDGASYLIHCGAQLVRNNDGQTPLDMATGALLLFSRP